MPGRRGCVLKGRGALSEELEEKIAAPEPNPLEGISAFAERKTHEISTAALP